MLLTNNINSSNRFHPAVFILSHTLDLSFVVLENLKDGQLAEANLGDMHELKVPRVLDGSFVVVPGELGFGRPSRLALHNQNVAFVDGLTLKKSYKRRSLTCEYSMKSFAINFCKKKSSLEIVFAKAILFFKCSCYIF